MIKTHNNNLTELLRLKAIFVVSPFVWCKKRDKPQHHPHMFPCLKLQKKKLYILEQWNPISCVIKELLSCGYVTLILHNTLSYTLQYVQKF